MSTVLFVCLHGAARSRMAAAWFNHVTPSGWWATSAGLEPQAAVSIQTVDLLAGTPAEEMLDRDAPRPIEAVGASEYVISIDCDVPGAQRWDLVHRVMGEAMRDELRERAEALAREIERDSR